MQWIAPSEEVVGTETLETRLWAAADQLRANSGLTSAQYSQPVLGLIFLRFADVRFLARRAILEKQAAGGRRGSRVDDPAAYQAEGVLYLTPNARFDFLLRLREGADGQGRERGDAGHRETQRSARWRPSEDLPALREHAAQRSAEGGMFVQGARFVTEHRKHPAAELSVQGRRRSRTP